MYSVVIEMTVNLQILLEYRTHSEKYIPKELLIHIKMSEKHSLRKFLLKTTECSGLTEILNKVSKTNVSKCSDELVKALRTNKGLIRELPEKLVERSVREKCFVNQYSSLVKKVCNSYKDISQDIFSIVTNKYKFVDGSWALLGALHFNKLVGTDKVINQLYLTLD